MKVRSGWVRFTRKVRTSIRNIAESMTCVSNSLRSKEKFEGHKESFQAKLCVQRCCDDLDRHIEKKERCYEMMNDIR